MRNIIRKIAKAIGIKTNYMVTVTAPHPGGGQAISTGVRTVRPWLHDDSMDELCRSFESKDMARSSNIIMIHRLGP